MLGRTEVKRKRGWQRMRWLDSIIDSVDVFEQTPGDSEGWGRLACCSPWGAKESDTTQQLNNNNNFYQGVDWPYHSWVTVLLNGEVPRVFQVLIFLQCLRRIKMKVVTSGKCISLISCHKLFLQATSQKKRVWKIRGQRKILGMDRYVNPISNQLRAWTRAGHLMLVFFFITGGC